MFTTERNWVKPLKSLVNIAGLGAVTGRRFIAGTELVRATRHIVNSLENEDWEGPRNVGD